MLSPVVVPAYGVFCAIWCSYLAFNPSGTKWMVVLISFLLTGLIPIAAIFALYRLGRISDTGLNERTERTVPYAITAIAYIACAFFLYRVGAPSWLWLFPVGGCLAVIVNMTVNRWWKISAHAAAMGGLVALLSRLAFDGVAMPWIIYWVTGAIMLTGLLGTARIVLGCHTPWQVAAGTFNGFISVFLITAL